MIDIGSIIQYIQVLLDSPWFIVAQILGGILTLVLLVAIVYLTRKNGNIERQIRHIWTAWNKTPIPKHRMAKRWDEIKEKMRGDNAASWREAILTADDMLDEILNKIGHEGETLEERLAGIRPEQFPALQEAHKAHRVNDFLTNDPSYALTKEVAEHTIEIYRNIFRETGIIL